MAFYIHNKKHYFTRFPLWLAVIAFCAFSPALIGLFGAWFTEFTTGEACHEGNCSWMVLPWLTLFTLPVGAAIGAIYLLITLIDTIALIRGNTKRKQNHES